MAEIPLILRLKKKVHKDIALAQDLIVEALYDVFPEAVLHGGTAIWRCYSGKRFSEDVDVYIEKDDKQIKQLFEKFKQKGFQIKKKISENSIYSSLNFQGTIIRFEALFKKIKGNLANYETAESNRIIIYSLTREELIKEKIETYLKRKKIRDLYDIFFLLPKSNPNKIKKPLQKLLKKYSAPNDKENLQTIILQGAVPNPGEMINFIRGYL